MIGRLFCGPAPARPPPPAEVKEAATSQHASLVSIGGIQIITKRPDPVPKDHAGDPSVVDGRQHSASPSPPHIVKRRGIGVLIHPTLVLTTHTTIPNARSIKDAEITICRDIATLTYVKRKFVPEIFFETNVELDLTVVSCEIICPEVKTMALDTTKIRRRALRREHTIFIMGCQMKRPDDVAILDGRIVGFSRTHDSRHHLVRFLAGDDEWMPGSVGFNEFGSFSFVVTRPPISNPRSALEAGGDIVTLESTQNISPASAAIFVPKPKQWGTCIQSIKEWIEPLWRRSRDEIFHESISPSLALAPLTTSKTQNDEVVPSTEVITSPSSPSQSDSPHKRRSFSDVFSGNLIPKVKPALLTNAIANNNIADVINSDISSTSGHHHHHHHHHHHKQNCRVVPVQDGDQTITTKGGPMEDPNSVDPLDPDIRYHEPSSETPHYSKSIESPSEQELSEDSGSSGGGSVEPLVPKYIECPRAVEHELHHAQFINIKSSQAMKRQEKGLEGLGPGDVNKAVAAAVAGNVKKAVMAKKTNEKNRGRPDSTVAAHRLSSVSVQTDEELMLGFAAAAAARRGGSEESVLIDVRPMTGARADDDHDHDDDDDGEGSSSASSSSNRSDWKQHEWAAAAHRSPGEEEEGEEEEEEEEEVVVQDQHHGGHHYPRRRRRGRERERWSLPEVHEIRAPLTPRPRSRPQPQPHGGMSSSSSRSSPAVQQPPPIAAAAAVVVGRSSDATATGNLKDSGGGRISGACYQNQNQPGSSSMRNVEGCWMDTYYNDDAKPLPPKAKAKAKTKTMSDTPRRWGGNASRASFSMELEMRRSRSRRRDENDNDNDDIALLRDKDRAMSTYTTTTNINTHHRPRPRPPRGSSPSSARSMPPQPPPHHHHHRPPPPPHEPPEEEEDGQEGQEGGQYHHRRHHHHHHHRPSSSRRPSSASDSVINADVAYSKPTISYMQKRNLYQRDSILARHAYQTTLPRWM